MKYSKDVFIYPYSEEEEKEILHNTIVKMAEDKAYNEGVDVGIKEGIEQKNIENAKKMKEKGFSIKDIQDITGLSEEKISEL